MVTPLCDFDYFRCLFNTGGYGRVARQEGDVPDDLATRRRAVHDFVDQAGR